MTHATRTRSTSTHLSFLAALLITLCATACGGSQQEQAGPQYAPSSANERYAAAYPAEVEALDARATEGDATARANITTFSQYPSQLKDPDWAITTQIITEADRAGRSEEMHEVIDGQRKVTSFVEDDSEDLSRRLGRSVDAEAQKSGLKKDFETRRPIKGALPKVVEQQLQEDLRKVHEAHVLIETHRDQLGKANAAALELQVDTITLTAHFVFVELELTRADLKKRVSEAEDVRKTTSDAIARHQATLSRADATASEKKAAQTRLTALQQSQTDLDPKLSAAQKNMEKLDERVDKLQKDYQAAFDALLKDLEAKTPKPQ
jgi:chromosome segregation ATPase